MATLSDRKIQKIANEATERFKGDLNTLESAIGAMYVGKYFGWKVLFLAHDRKTIKKYENILDISFRDSFAEESSRSQDLVAFAAAQNISNFWKAVRGEIPGIRTPKIR